MNACPECGGSFIDGSVAFPILGGPRFTYRVKTMDISAGIAGRMCEDCGYLALRVRDPGRIRDARDAVRRAEGGT